MKGQVQVQVQGCPELRPLALEFHSPHCGDIISVITFKSRQSLRVLRPLVLLQLLFTRYYFVFSSLAKPEL